MIEVLANAMVVIIVQATSVSSQHDAHLKLTQFICLLYVNKTGRKKDAVHRPE